MTLEKALVPVNFSGALDQKKNFKTVMPGRFLTLQNAIRRKHNLWEKRYGFSALSKTGNSFIPLAGGGATATPFTVTAGKHLANFRDSLVMTDGARVMSYSTQKDTWTAPTTSAVPIAFDRRTLARGNSIQGACDVAYAAGLMAVIWEESGVGSGTGGVFYAIYDDATGSPVVPATVLSTPSGSLPPTNTFRPRVVANSTNFLFCYRSLGSAFIIAYMVPVASPTTAPVLNILGDTSVVADACWDIEFYDQTAAIFTYNNTTHGVSFLFVNYSDGQPTGGGYAGLTTLASATNLGTQALSVVPDAARGYVYVFYYDNATNNNLNVACLAQATLTGNQSVFVTATNVRNVTGAVLSNGTVQVFYEYNPQTPPSKVADAKSQYIGIGTTKWTGSGAPTTVITTIATTQTTFLPRLCMGLGSKAFVNSANNQAYVYGAYDSQLQPAYYLIGITDGIVLRVAQNVGGGLWKSLAAPYAGTGYGTALISHLPRVFKDSSNAYSTVLQERTKAQISSGGTILGTQFGLNRYGANFSTGTHVHDVLGQSMYLSGGLVKVYDGTFCVEQGFHVYPEDTTTAVFAGGTLVGGTYTYALTYEWVDAAGQLHRSAPSVAATITPGAGNYFQISVPVVASVGDFTKYSNAYGTVKTVAWVSTTNGTILYRYGAFSTSAALLNITTEPDPTQEVLYTTGGILPNIAAPSASCAHVHKDRLFLGGLETDEIAFSKQFSSGIAPAFSDVFRIPLESQGGKVFALASLDDKLCIFKKDRIYYIYGEGPNDAGALFDYPQPIRIPCDVGTIAPNSIVETPKGIIFKTPKGFFILSRYLQVAYIGENVEDYNNLTVSSATIMADENAVRFTHSDGECLIYNWHFGEWYTFSNYTAVSSAVANGGTFYHLKADGTVNKEVVGLFNDNGTTINMTLETSWLSLAQLQGFQRIYKMLVLGDFVSHFHVRYSIAYDFLSTYNQVINSDTRNTTSTNVYQLRIQPAVQKCTAIKLKIETIDDIVAGGGANVKFTSIGMEIGRKRGAYKLASSATV